MGRVLPGNVQPLDMYLADPPSEPIVCPHLGVDDDPTTRFLYSSDGNCCWRLKRPAEVSLSHQSQFCLGNTHTSCPVYVMGRPATGVKVLRASRVSTSPQVGPIGWRSIVVAIEAGIAIFIAASLIYYWVVPSNTPVRTPYSLPTHAPKATVPVIAELPTLIPDLPLVASTTSISNLTATESTSIGIGTQTIGSAATSSAALVGATLTPSPGLDQPVGPYNLIAHTVEPGENLVSIAARFDTTRELLVKVNGLSDQRVLEPGQMLVVPQGQTDVGQLPKMVAFLTVQETPLDVIISQLSGDMAVVRQLNSLGEGNLVPAGRWLFIPQP